MAGNQGFASMDDNKQKENAHKSGKASGGNHSRNSNRSSNAHASGTVGSAEAAKRGGQHSHHNR